MKESKQLLLANRAWANELIDEDPDFFRRQTGGQRPEFLWIGSTDSRVSPEQKTQSLPGRLLVHRNMGNLVNPDDLNFMSVLQYAVETLEVPNIIICGDYGCGGLRSVLDGGATGAIDRWLNGARAVLADHREEIEAQSTPEARLNRLVEVNVRDQLVKLARTDPVQAAFAAGRSLTLHGWIYDIRDGLLKPLMKINRTTDLADVARPDRVLLTTAELEAEVA
jgi:carbonic anhydrase